jgi:hypothetical protein
MPALVGVRHLREGNLSVASSILENIKFHTLPGEAITHVMRGLLRFMLMLLSFAYIAAAMGTALADGQSSYPTLPSDLTNALFVLGAGMLGSAVSLLSRISEFERVSRRSQRYLFFTGATSPIVGGISALVIAALIQSKLIPLDITIQNYWVCIVVGFLSGFSERFSGNLLRIAQDHLVASDEKSGPEKSVERSLDHRGSGIIVKT